MTQREIAMDKTRRTFIQVIAAMFGLGPWWKVFQSSPKKADPIAIKWVMRKTYVKGSSFHWVPIAWKDIRKGDVLKIQGQPGSPMMVRAKGTPDMDYFGMVFIEPIGDQ